MLQSSHGLSDEQKQALGKSVRLIEAGPGTGKTRTVVSRFAQRASERPGVALLSFTNAAVTVAKIRLQRNPEALSSPNFIGTFDSFFNRYVVTPQEVLAGRNPPTFVPSWDVLPDHLSVVRPRQGGPGFALSRWRRDPHGLLSLDPNDLPWEQCRSWNGLPKNIRVALQREANGRIQMLLNAQVFDSNHARTLALMHLGDSTITQRLSTRFHEIIVDEFQDCTVIEHQILRILENAGSHLIAVADPDQSIYQFRDKAKPAYRGYRDSIQQSDFVVLSTCHRSTPAICDLATSLRTESLSAVKPRPGDPRNAPVQVVAGKGPAAGALAARIVSGYGISLEATRILSHKRADSLKLVHQKSSKNAGTTKFEKIFRATITLGESTDARARRQAVAELEMAFIELLEWPDGHPPATQDEVLDALGASSEQLRVIAWRIAATASRWTDERQAVSLVRQVVSESAGAIGHATVPLTQKLRKPTAKVWTLWEEHAAGLAAGGTSFPKCSHVHAVKGAEFDAVIYALPDPRADHVLDHWESQKSTEARRVLYVGVTRAKDLLVLVVPPSRKDQLIKLLNSNGIDHAVHAMNT